jgi:hypothetical protein
VNGYDSNRSLYSIFDNGFYAGLPYPDQLDGGYKPDTRLIPIPTLFDWNIVGDSEGSFRSVSFALPLFSGGSWQPMKYSLQVPNTELYATLADPDSPVVDGIPVWIQYKQAHLSQLWKFIKVE